MILWSVKSARPSSKHIIQYRKAYIWIESINFKYKQAQYIYRMSFKSNILGSDDRMYIKKRGIIDLDKMYNDIRQWFLNKRYEFHEEDHKSKVPSPTGSEEEINFKCWRKEDEFTKWWIKMNWDMWDKTEVVVNVNGKPKKMVRCRFKAWIVPEFEFDFENKWEKSSFLRGLRKFYVKQVIKKRVDVEGDKFEYEFHELQDLIKRDLGISSSGSQFAHFWKP